MPTQVATAEPPSFLGTTLRRSIVLGRLFLAVGIIYSVIIAVVVSGSSATAFVAGVALFLPIFAVMGSMGALVVFTNDRVKGVFEYLIAYGISPRRIFINIVSACLLLATIVLTVALTFGLGLFIARGHTVSTGLATFLVIYPIPMSYASAVFAATVGMFWTSLSSPRQGINSPIGLMPFIGIGPSLLTLVVVAAIGAADGGASFYLVSGGAVILLVSVVLLLLSQTGRLLPLERLLSPE